MADESYQDKTEEATPRRREEAKKKGQVVKSREIPSVGVLMVGITVLFFLGASIFQQLSTLMVQLFQEIGTSALHPSKIQDFNRLLIQRFLFILSPVLIALCAVSIASHLAQSGIVFSTEMLRPNWSKISPLTGIRRVFSRQSLAELFKSLFKILIVGGVAYIAVKKEIPHIFLLVDEETGSILNYIGTTSVTLLLKVGLVLMVLAGLDYLFQRWSFEKNLRMSKQEIKEEFKTTEGDPLIKSRIRSIQRQLARRRMMAEVPKADVIVTNPTHLAIALCYRSKEMEAPRVIAKGAGFIAERIVEIARKHDIPVIEHRPLAQALYKAVELGQMIPSTLYQVVADVLAYVYRIKKKVL